MDGWKIDGWDSQYWKYIHNTENTFSYLGWVVVDDHGIFLILKNKDIIYFRITQKHCKPYNNKEKWS